MTDAETPPAPPDDREDPRDPLPPGRSPYKNLWVPLVVVPALVVMVLLAVAAFFGLVAGEEATIEQNLHDVVHGGANERTQAVFQLSQQVAMNVQAEAEGRERPWAYPADFSDRLHAAWDDVDEDDWEIRQVLAYLMALQSDPEGVTHLLQLAEIPESEDPDGRIRFQVLMQLGQLGDERAAPLLVRHLDHADPGLRAVAAVALQRMSGPEVRAALRGALGDEAFDVRANAALSLSHLGDDAGAELLRELAGREAYEVEHDLDRRRYRRADVISASRVSAIEALDRLDRSEDRAFLEGLRRDDDILVREAAMVALGEAEDS